MKGIQNFEYYTRLANDKKKEGRWGFDFLEKILSRYNPNVKKLWVCGTPAMNMEFERSMEVLGPMYGVGKFDYDII